MPEIRQNIITGDWVIIATERAKRPDEFTRMKERLPAAERSPDCPFCPGNEEKTSGEKFRIPGDGGEWLVRCVPNKFSALVPEGEVRRHENGFRKHIDGVGLHEVIIESPRHDAAISRLSLDHVKSLLLAYKNRFLDFYGDDRIKHVIIFKNHGESAGTSLEHPHSQIVGTPVVPGLLRVRVEEALRHYGNLGECLYCRSLRQELSDGVRIIDENSSFVAFIPYAALSPFHIGIFPKRHDACFGNITAGEVSNLAAILRDTLLRISLGLDDPDYNFIFRSLPPEEGSVKYFHWYISLIPRVTRAAGFELGTGMFINTALPEKSAEFLRSVKMKPPA